MSAVEIIAELPKLTPEERSDIRRRLRELEEHDEQLFLHEAADAMFQDIDSPQLEAKLLEAIQGSHSPYSRKEMESVLKKVHRDTRKK